MIHCERERERGRERGTPPCLLLLMYGHPPPLAPLGNMPAHTLSLWHITVGHIIETHTAITYKSLRNCLFWPQIECNAHTVPLFD